MPTSKTTPSRDSAGLPVPLDAAADALSRAAGEAARQHERVAKLNERGAHHSEMQEATQLCELAHHHLKARAELYESSASGGKGAHDDAFWHAASDYGRRHTECDASSSKFAKHSSEKLGELTLDYELEASALLNMRAALSAYRKLRPDA
jgi:hypothetical protein